MSIKDVINKISDTVESGFEQLNLTKTDLKTIANSTDAKQQIQDQINMIRMIIAEEELKHIEKEPEPTVEELVNEYNILIEYYNNIKSEV